MKDTFFFLGLIIAISCCLWSCHVINPIKSNKTKMVKGVFVKNGKWVESDSTLNIQFVKYLNGRKNGKIYSIDSSGYYSTGRYKNGIKEGWFKYYTNKGYLMYEYLYKNDTIIKSGIYYGPTF